MTGRFVRCTAVLIAVALATLTMAVPAHAEGDAPTHFFVRTDVPDSATFVVATVKGGDVMACSTQAELAGFGVVVNAVYGCELIDVLPAGAFGFTVQTSSQTSDDPADDPFADQ